VKARNAGKEQGSTFHFRDEEHDALVKSSDIGEKGSIRRYVCILKHGPTLFHARWDGIHLCSFRFHQARSFVFHSGLYSSKNTTSPSSGIQQYLR
jgi:hypothetical protein